MRDELTIERIRREWRSIKSKDERRKRLWAAVHARTIGRGGITLVSRVTGITRDTIRAGLKELESPKAGQSSDRVRAGGGGRKRLTVDDPGLIAALDALIEPREGATRTPLRWTCRSTRSLAETLSDQSRCMRDGSERTRNLDGAAVATLLHIAGYNLRSNRRSITGSELPDRDAQFEYLHTRVGEFLRQGQPVIAVDTGEVVAVESSRNADVVGTVPGKPLLAGFEGFLDPALKAFLFAGCIEVVDNRRWSSIGITEETAALAVAAIERWWREFRTTGVPHARKLLIAADCGGRDNRRTRIWKGALQTLADSTGLKLTVCHLPRGTVKWTGIKQQLLSFARSDKPGTPILPHLAVVSAVGRPRVGGPTVKAVIDGGDCRPFDAEFEERGDASTIEPALVRGDWNYAISPAKAT